MNYKRILIHFGVLIFLTHFSLGQKVQFEHLSNNDGMVGSKVTSVLKDYQGYMWFGTYDGLSRYDGYSFTNFVNEPNNPNSLLDNFVACLYETRNKQLLVGLGYKGLCLFNRQSETFIRFSHNESDTTSLVHNFVSAIHEDAHGNIWIATRGGLDRLDLKTKKFFHYKIFSVEDPAVTSIDEDKDHNLWLFGKTKTLCKFNPEKNSREYVDFSRDMNTEKFYRGGVLKHDSKGNVWIGENGGLLRYDPLTKRLVKFSVENQQLKGNLIFSIMEDSEKKIWIGSDGGGLYRYDYLSDSLESFLHHPEDASSLSGNGVYCVYESEPGLIWVGVYAAGVNIYKRDKSKFQSISIIGKKGMKLNHKSVFSISKSKDHKIWFGTDGGGLNLYDPLTKQIEYFTKENSRLHSNIIKCIARDRDNNLWLGSFGSSLQKINFEKRTDTLFKVGKDPTKSVLIDNIWSLHAEADGKIFIGLLGYGMQIYDPLSRSFEHYPYDTAAAKITMCDISVLQADHLKRVWIGSGESGLGYYDPATRSITHLRHDPQRSSSISSNEVSDIFEDRNHHLWVGTMFTGLNKLVDIKKQTFLHYTMKDGLPSNNIKSILEDSHGNLWISTDNGICIFKIKENKFIGFGKEDGLIQREFNYPSKLKTADGTMYFGGINGVTVFHPDSMRFNQHTPPIVFTDLKIFNESIKPYKKYEGRIYLKNALSLTREITLTSDDYMFSIEFAALDFISSHHNKYAYQLMGFSNKWTYVDADKRFATYTNLDAGTYTFKVIACNNDGVWNKKGISLNITILPPWYEKWWFRILVVFSVIASIIMYYYYRIGLVKRRNLILSEEVKRRTAELKLANEELLMQKEEIVLQKNELEEKKSELEYSNKTKDKFFSILGHDLKGPVSALTSLTNMLISDWPKLDDGYKLTYLGHIDQSSRQVKNLVFNLLEWAGTQSNHVKTMAERLFVKKLFQDTLALLSEQATQKNIHVIIETKEDHIVFGDNNMISTIIRNILSNSIKYTPRGGEITMSSSQIDDSYIILKIKDNGVGMREAVLKDIFSLDKGPSAKGTENEIGTGLGLIICQEFAEMNGGKIYAESELGQGSTFYIQLPVK